MTYLSYITDVKQMIEKESAVETFLRERRALRLTPQQPVYLFGAGRLGSFVREWLIECAHVQPKAFVDNNAKLCGRERDGLAILPPVGLDTDAQFIVTAYNTWSIRRQLASSGVTRITPYHHVFWADAAWFHEHNVHGQHRIDCPTDLRAAWSEIERAHATLSDDKSRQEFCEQLMWRFTLDDSVCTEPDDAADIYFPALFTLGPEEVFVDCGAYDGDTIEEFVARCPQYKEIIAFEPDPVNRAKLGEATIYPFALGDRNTRALFVVRGDATSRLAVNEDGLEVQCVTLDSLGIKPTFIKMDIEGAEPAALRGAAETIRKYKPVVAACIYHQGEHLWTIPNYLHELVPEYSIFVRRYAEECRESVCYAVPKGRK